jgi:anti-sigma regulatory factor (Ser/Thr protein kinase)
LVAHDLSRLVDDVQLVTTELVTNAMRHAQTPFTVILREFKGTVRLEVLDGCPVQPILVVAGSEDDGGRGISIVDAVSREWGVTSRGAAGKSVWAEFST